MSIFGFAFKKPEDVYSKRTIVYLDFKKSNPITAYDEADKNSLFVVNGTLPLQYLMFKKGTTKLEGNFVIVDTIDSLTEYNIKCLDCVVSSGLTMRTKYEGDIDYLMKDNAISKFPKKLLKVYKKNKLYRVVSTRLIGLKHIHKELSFDSVLNDFNKACEQHKVNLKTAHELFARAITNNIAYEKLLELGEFAKKFVPKLKKICSKGELAKSIVTFQDIVYYMTDKEIALAEDLGNEEIVSKLFEMWEPKPTKKKEIKFSFNKKPLPKNRHISKKKRKAWEEQDNIIPSYIAARRKKHQKSPFNPKCIGFEDITIPTMAEGVYSKKKLCKFLGIENCQIIGGYRDGKIVLRHGEIISIKNLDNNSFNYIKVL